MLSIFSISSPDLGYMSQKGLYDAERPWVPNRHALYDKTTTEMVELSIMTKKRISKDNYYLNIASEVSRRGTCLRRNFGAVIVNNDEIVSTGYTGAPRGAKNCIDIGYCPRTESNIPSGERYELCRSVHAEMNALIHASRSEAIGGVMYLIGIDAATGKPIPDGAEPCMLCKRVIINAGIEKVITRNGEKEIETFLVSGWAKEEKIEFEGYISED